MKPYVKNMIKRQFDQLAQTQHLSPQTSNPLNYNMAEI